MPEPVPMLARNEIRYIAHPYNRQAVLHIAKPTGDGRIFPACRKVPPMPARWGDIGTGVRDPDKLETDPAGRRICQRCRTAFYRPNDNQDRT